MTDAGAAHDVFVGKDLGWKAVDTSPSAVEHYIDITGDDNPWYRGASPFGAPVLPATFLHYRAYEHNPGWFPNRSTGRCSRGSRCTGTVPCSSATRCAATHG